MTLHQEIVRIEVGSAIDAMQVVRSMRTRVAMERAGCDEEQIEIMLDLQDIAFTELRDRLVEQAIKWAGRGRQ